MELQRVLKIRMEGEDVKEIQSLLNKIGYNIPVDGKYGMLTANKVKDFQKRNHLPVTGAVDKRTYEKLIGVAIPPSVSTPITTSSFTVKPQNIVLIPVPKVIDDKSPSAVIKKVQQHLADIGYTITKPYTGVWDKETMTAVKLFKKDFLRVPGQIYFEFMVSPKLSREEFKKLDSIARSYRERLTSGEYNPPPPSYQVTTPSQPPIVPKKATEETLEELAEEVTPENVNSAFILAAVIFGLLLLSSGKKQQEEKLPEQKLESKIEEEPKVPKD